MSVTPLTTCFSASRLNDTTFLIIEDDKWNENPYIYAKISQETLVLIDTGCGGAAKEVDVELTSLRAFLETYPVADNGGKPLNMGAARTYVVICTHCHYDHIGGIEDFSEPGAQVWASSYDKGFIEDPGRLSTSSLCCLVGMKTPHYQVSHWAQDGQHTVDNSGRDLGLVLYHTPGHTPDQLAIWDRVERVLFVGDTIYEWSAILFPPEGDFVKYSDTIGKLKGLVREWNQDTNEGQYRCPPARVKMACGHNTCNVDAHNLLGAVDRLVSEIAESRIQPSDAGFDRGEQIELYRDKEERLSFRGPARTFAALRSDMAALDRIRRRQMIQE